MVRVEIVPNENPMIICLRDGIVLNARANVVAEITEHVGRRSSILDTSNPTTRIGDTATGIALDTWIPRLDSK